MPRNLIRSIPLDLTSLGFFLLEDGEVFLGVDGFAYMKLSDDAAERVLWLPDAVIKAQPKSINHK
jgi:hypothetical protein